MRAGANPRPGCFDIRTRLPCGAYTVFDNLLKAVSGTFSGKGWFGRDLTLDKLRGERVQSPSIMSVLQANSLKEPEKGKPDCRA